MSAHRRLTFAGSVVGAVIVALDGTVLTVAQPTLQRDLHASLAQVQWTSTGYLIAVAGLLVFAGRLGDRYGHRRIFALGMLGFGAASAGIGSAPGINWVIGLRVVQGIFGALLQPATLGMLRAAYPPEKLGMPIAVRTSAIGVAAAAGPLVGGALVTSFGWRAVFFLNIAPALVMGVLAAVAGGPEQTPAARPPLDLPGAGLLAATLVCVVYALVGIPDSGRATAFVAALIGAAAAGCAFVRHERRTASPLVPAGMLGPAAAGPALGLLVAASAAMLGALFVTSYVLQNALGLDPLHTALRGLPGPVAMVLGGPVAAVLMRRYGPRRTAGAAVLLLALGVLVLTRIGEASEVVSTGMGFLLMGAGFVTVMVTATTVVVRQVPVASAGVAGGLKQTAMNVGPTVGVAAASTLMTCTNAAPGPTLAVLAAVSLLGVPFALRLPGRPGHPASPDIPASLDQERPPSVEGPAPVR
ncbi:MFS transporter [Streptomyces yaanensis]|uniref:MFS transporter n=1 Tax=Streptomyces yaanensis TaxID=1142239 RepID=A0ABV7SBX4_9ACTN|nr:MFS transporter [Streptomyces sp. CGMCC 4.7035]WNB99051.1 MFS transporter [Streptomyces sp. CGMCC 4.7035]